MHTSALLIGKSFLEAYARPGATVVDLGAYDINGSLRSVCPPDMQYLGLDMAAGPGVDVVVEPDQPLPLRNGHADLVVSSSAFEHDGAFWMSFLEVVRITKEGGFIYINVPSNGHVHSHPEDCWRFYPDAGRSLERWARRQGLSVTLVESFVAERRGEFWNDFVAVFKRGEIEPTDRLPFLSAAWPSTNIRKWGEPELLNARELTEDMVLLEEAKAELLKLRGSLPRGAVARDVGQEPSRARPAVVLSPLTSGSPVYGVIDTLNGRAIEGRSRVSRNSTFKITGWVLADGFDPAAPNAARYLVLDRAGGASLRLFVELGPAYARPDVSQENHHLDAPFLALPGFSVTIASADLDSGTYRLGFAVSNAEGTRGSRLGKLLQVE
jgi:SAM-dependent methyltransferase